jgi:hypothetical protein
MFVVWKRNIMKKGGRNFIPPPLLLGEIYTPFLTTFVGQ